MKNLAENLWTIHYRLPLLGDYLGRNVTVVRLSRSGELVIHSTGPFTPADVAAVSALGRPGWLVEAYNKLDTFSKEGSSAFPTVPYLAPAGFSEIVGFPVRLLDPPPAAWAGELDILEIGGKPKDPEYVTLHRSSRTLIVADLLFNVTKDAPLGPRIFGLAAVKSHAHEPGLSRPEAHAIADKAAFRASMQTVLSWDFDRIIVGHGETIETGGKEKLAAALREAKV